MSKVAYLLVTSLLTIHKGIINKNDKISKNHSEKKLGNPE